MSSSSNTRVFISYAWKDDQPFVERLYHDLQRLGYDPWMDTQNMPSRGRSLPREVEEQLEKCDRVLAVVGPAAITSEACRAERAFAFNLGKVVTAILRLGEYAMLPPELSQYFVPDFRESRSYEAALDELQRVLQDLPVIPGRLFDVPAVPPHLQPRPGELRALRESITAAELKETTVITSAGHVGLQGMGGVGKTVMAALTARDYTVRRQFQNGIIWLTFGREPNVLAQVQKALTALGNDGTKSPNVSLARMQLGQALDGKECLLILDDVWNAADAEPFFRAMNPRCRLLITTRILEVVGALGARTHPLDVLSVEQSSKLLASWCAAKPEDLPPEAAELVRECGRLPLALSMIGAMLRGKPPAFWKHVRNLIRHADLAKIKAQFPDYPHTDLLRAIQVSVEALDPKSRERYLALAVLLEDMPIHPAIQQTLWGVDEGEALETAEQFVSLSLAQRDGPQRDGNTPNIRLHDLQLDYVRAQYPESDREALETIRAAVRLSGHVIERDPRQVASQLLGRLLSNRSPRVQKLLRLAAEYRATPWLKPQTASLTAPGGPLVRVLAGHSDMVFAVALTPDGKRAVSASQDQTLKVWDLESGKELQTLTGHSKAVNAVAVMPDGKRAVSASDDKTLRVWDLESGKELQTLAASAYAVALTPDGKRAVSASWDEILKVWDLESGKELQTIASPSDRVHKVALMPDGKCAALASWDETLKVWDLESGKELRTLAGHSRRVTAVAVTPDGKRAVSASYDQTLKVWDLESGKEVQTLAGHSNEVRGVAVTPDGKRAVSASADQTLKVWDLESGKEVQTLVGHSRGVTAVAVTPDGRRAVSASWDKTLKVWDLSGAGKEVQMRAGHSDGVDAVVVTPDGRRAVSASEDQTLKVWDLGSGKELQTLAGHSGRVHAVAVTPDGKRAVSASWDRTLKVWDLANGKELQTLAGHSDGVVAVVVTPDGQCAVSASEDQTLKVWNLESGKELRTLAGHSGRVHAVAVTPDGKRSVSASWDKTLKVWDLESGKELQTLAGHGNGVRGVALAPDGKRAVSACMDETLKVWDLASGKELQTLAGHSYIVNAVAVTLDGKRAVSASPDETLKVWDLASGKELQTLAGHSGGVDAVTLTPDGKRAVSASEDLTLRVWEIETGKVVTAFTADARLLTCAVGPDGRVIVAGDASGRVHFLSLELQDDN